MVSTLPRGAGEPAGQKAATGALPLWHAPDKFAHDGLLTQGRTALAWTRAAASVLSFSVRPVGRVPGVTERFPARAALRRYQFRYRHGIKFYHSDVRIEMYRCHRRLEGGGGDHNAPLRVGKVEG